MTDMTACPACGTEGTGKFCGACGSSMEAAPRAAFCTGCGKAPEGEERFCTECGTPLTAEMAGLSAERAERIAAAGPGASDGPSSATPAERAAAAIAATPKNARVAGRPPAPSSNPWLPLITAVLLATGAGIVIGKLGSGGEDLPMPTPGASAGAIPGDPSSVDLASMTPMQAAVQLFDRVIGAVENADTAQAEQFLPMAIAAHQRAEPLDNDGLFHLTILQRLAGQQDEAIASAERVLSDHPTNLLALASAGEAALEGGDTTAAEAYYQRFVDAYEDEQGRDLPEYQQHGNLLAGMRAAALRLLSGA